MDAEKQSSNPEGPKNGAGGFCLSAAHEVLQQLDSSRNLEALGHSLSVFENQLKSVQLIYRLQSALALEFGLHGALAEGCAIATGAVGDANGLSMDPNSAASGMPDIFSVNSDCFVDRELVRALAWQANCQQEAVRKELRAYQRAVSDRLSLAAKRAKPRDPEAPPPAAASGGRSTQATATQGPAAGGAAPYQKGSQQELQQQQSLPQPPGDRQPSLGNADVMPTVDERIYCLDEREEAARKAQLAKLSTLINPETGGISTSPISVVGVFQQQMMSSSDWRVRRVALEAMSRSPLDVLWRLLQNSRVLDCLHNWLQDAVADHQFTMLKLLLSTMTCLPMRRDLLKGSKLEAALEGLAYAGGQQSGGGGGAAAAAAAAAGNDGGPALVMRNRFGDAAAAVLAEWRKDPDHVTLLRRAGGHVPEIIPAAAAASTAVAARVGGVGFDAKSKGGVAAAAAASAAAGAAAPPVPGSRLLGAAAAAKDGMRKRALSSPRPMGDARASPKPRVAEANGQISAASGKNAALIPALAASAAAAGTSGRGNSGTAGGGSSGVLRRDSLAAAAPSVPVQQAVDMTAKLGEKGPADPDVVAGFRSRFGDGSVRRSQLARPARIPSASNAAATREASPEPVAAPSGSSAATGREGKFRGTAGRDPSEERPSAAAAAAVGGHPGGTPTLMDSELGPDALARLRAERQAQRQAAALAALQAEARRHPEVMYSEQVFEEKMKAFRQVQAARELEEQQRALRPDDVRRAHQSMRATVPWPGPPPKIWLPEDQPAGGRGEESEERQEQANIRQQRPKVSYPNKDCIPDSPAEPPPSAHHQQQQKQQLPPRAIPWFPAVDGEEVALDWFRQNLVLWERGIRRAEHVLPPALLHRHLELHPKHLPPQYAAPAKVAPGGPSRSAATRHKNKQSPQELPPPPALAAPPKLGEVSPRHIALVPLPEQQRPPSLLQLQPQVQMIEASAAVTAPWTATVAAEQHALPPLQQLQPPERKAKWCLMPPVPPPPAAAPVPLGMMSTLLPLHVQPPPVQQAYEPHGRANGGQPYYDNYGAQAYGHRQTRLEEKGRSLHHDGPVQGEYGGLAGDYGGGEAYSGQHYVKQDQDYQRTWR